MHTRTTCRRIECTRTTSAQRLAPCTLGTLITSSFSAGTDLLEMHRIATDPDFERGRHGFPGLVDALQVARELLG